MKTQDLWFALSAQSFPYLHELGQEDQDSFVLLDAYLRGCLEEWDASGSQLSARSIVLLDDCARSITRRFQLLDGEGQCYFGQFRRLARRILRGIDVDRAYRQATQELDAEPGWRNVCDDQHPESTLPVDVVKSEQTIGDSSAEDVQEVKESQCWLPYTNRAHFSRSKDVDSRK